jgi:oxygen-independent coproporphyrinogen-3 oxidase
MYDALCRRLASAGLAQYEISNWSKPGRACRHNLKYWRRQSFLALGPSAHGLLGNRRWANPAPLKQWLEAYDAGPAPVLREVPLAEARFEWVFLHLRLNSGLPMDDYYSTWGETFVARYREPLERLCRQGLLEICPGGVRLTARARFLSDGVFAEFAGV